ncbi:MAG: hypothetical protein AABY22_31495 [Nanoarchaeota archaeon]
MKLKYKYRGKNNLKIKIVCSEHGLQTTVDLFDERRKILGVGCRKHFEKLPYVQDSFKKLDLDKK